MNSFIAFLFLLGAQEELIELDSNCMDCHEHQGDDWKASVHGRQRVGCVGCHGSDKVDKSKLLRPHLYTETFLRGKKRIKTEEKDGEEVETVIAEAVTMCNKCHQGVVAAFKDGEAHYDEVMDPDSRKWKGCQNCHPFHTMQRADFTVIVNRKPEGCARCHKPTTKKYKDGKACAEEIAKLRAECRRLEDRLKSPIPGISQYLEQLQLDDCRQKLMKARTKQHTQLFKEVADEIKPASRKAAEAYNTLVTKDQGVGGRKWALLGFLVFLGLNTLVARAWLKKGRAAS